MSQTDPETGHMKHPDKPRGQYDLSQQTVDTDHGVILAVTVTSGDVNDSMPYLNPIEHIRRHVSPCKLPQRMPFMASDRPTRYGYTEYSLFCPAAALLPPHQGGAEAGRFFL